MVGGVREGEEDIVLLACGPFNTEDSDEQNQQAESDERTGSVAKATEEMIMGSIRHIPKLIQLSQSAERCWSNRLKH